MITRLFMTRRFEVVERQMLNKIIKEHKLTYTHFFDEESVKEIGKLLGVGAIASGSVTDLNGSVKVNARIIATDTGSIFAVASVKILKDITVTKLLEKKAKSPYYERKIAAKTPEIPSPAPEKPKLEEPLPEKPIPEKPKEKPSVSLPKVEANNFTFEAKGCKMSGTSVACKVLITNNGQDREFDLHGRSGSRSRMFDDFGNEYITSQVQLANKVGTQSTGNLLLVSGIPTKAKLSFEKVSRQTSRVVLLDIGCWSKDTGKSFKVQLRNIPLLK